MNAIALPNSGTTSGVWGDNTRVYVTDYITNIVQAYNLANMAYVGVYAGKYTGGYGTGYLSGDGGKATSATMNMPVGMFTDSAGNMFIADQQNNRIRKMSTTGIMTTFAGTEMKFSGDGGPAKLALLYLSKGAIYTWQILETIVFDSSIVHRI